METMGLTNYSGAVVRKKDIDISQNYLEKDELEDLNRIVTMFLDHAEDMARGKTPMTMQNWNESLNEFLKFRRREILQGPGSVSHEQMERKVLQEYAFYHARRLKMPDLNDTELDAFEELPER